MNKDEELIRKNIEAHGERMAAISIAAHERSRRLLNMEDDLEMLDLDGLLNIWLTHYEDLTEQDRALLPLRPVYFLAEG